MNAENWTVEGAITSVVGDRVVEVQVETTSGDWPRGEVLTIRISEDVDREPLGHPYEEGFLKEHYLGKRVHCVVRRRGGRLEAIRFEWRRAMIPKHEGTGQILRNDEKICEGTYHFTAMGQEAQVGQRPQIGPTPVRRGPLRASGTFKVKPSDSATMPSDESSLVLLTEDGWRLKIEVMSLKSPGVYDISGWFEE